MGFVSFIFLLKILILIIEIKGTTSSFNCWSCTSWSTMFII
jgi:hypothetical protein